MCPDFLPGPAAPVPLFPRTRAGKSVRRAYVLGRGQQGTDFHLGSRPGTPARDGQYPAGWQRLQQACSRLPRRPGSSPQLAGTPLGNLVTDVTSWGLTPSTVQEVPTLLSRGCCAQLGAGLPEALTGKTVFLLILEFPNFSDSRIPESPCKEFGKLQFGRTVSTSGSPLQSPDRSLRVPAATLPAKCQALASSARVSVLAQRGAVHTVLPPQEPLVSSIFTGAWSHTVSVADL